ncbi:MAG: nucleoside triphosphate pyrophosphohydrolase [Bacteroidales bacterium]|nr:nucleoside triphosphate pyrophosphohydrolase [Bacteroidales bacterium]
MTTEHTKASKMQAFGQLLDIMDELREKCPWDKKQTFETLRPLTIEECFELNEALLHEDYAEVCKELGDIIMHIVFYAKVGEEKQLFDIQEILEKVCAKLKFRHPHIYADAVAETASDVEMSWEKIKQREKDGNKTVLAGVPDSLPSMIKAYRMQDKARGVGFDWEHKEDAWEKVQEEISEVQAELSRPDERGDKAALEAEFGDLFFSLINVARLYKINPDNALERSNQKFRNRFNYLEAKAKEDGKVLKDMSLAQMDEYYNEAKKLYR